MAIRTLTQILGGLIVALNTSITYAALITVEPDDFADGTDISSAFPGVTLSALDGGNNVILTPSVFSTTSLLASTGTQVFGHDGVFTQTWANGLVADLRIDFSQATDFVSIDIIANDGFDPGFLQAFDAADTLLDSFTTQGDLGSGASETATVSSLSANIAYVIASGVSGNDIALDNLRFNSAAVIPEPVTLTLLGLGVAGIGYQRRKQIKAA